MKGRVVIAALALVLAGCGGETSRTAAAPQPSARALPPQARVSTGSACKVLFPPSGRSPLVRVAEILGSSAGSNVSPVQARAFVSYYGTIQSVADIAPATLQGQLLRQVRVLKPMADGLRTGGQGSIPDTTQLRASGLEIVKICTKASTTG